MKPTLAFDMEVYVNYTLLLFKNVQTGAVRAFELPLTDDPIVGQIAVLRHIVLNNLLITFNGIGYDILLLMLVLRGADSLKIKQASNRIIEQNLKWWNFEKEFHINAHPEELDHIDLMEVAPLTGGLKLYGARLHAHKLQNLPVDPSARVTDEQKVILRAYCENDCDVLIDLFRALKVQIELREQMSAEYGIDLRSKSDAQIAEAVIKKEVETRLGRQMDKPTHGSGDEFHYVIPPWMSFKMLDILDTMREATFKVGDKGAVLMPEGLKKKKIEIGTGVYRMGIGGLHSSETRQVKTADETYVMMDFDVVSYYPSILLNQGLYPKHIGPAFLDVYRALVSRRLTAKAAGKKAISESLKITINGTFGKLSSRFSGLYSPDLFIQITVTGQLALLMLIESLWATAGVEVVSANTDGVTIRCPKTCVSNVFDTVKTWELITEFETERADYTGLYSRDVNNYVAVKTNGEVKVKGAYGTGLPLHKNPYMNVCSKAVIDYLTLDASVEATVRSETDIRQFLCCRTVSGNATYHDEDIGKIVRWYYSTLEEESLLYKVNQHLVPNALHAVPVFELPEALPADLDYDHYIAEANNMLTDLGVAI